MRIEREHRGDVTARRMAGERDPLGIAAILRGMVARPFDRQRAVLDEGREARLRDQSIIGQDGDEALAGEGRAGKAIVAARAIHPAAAVEEDHHRKRRLGRASRRPHVQLLPRVGAVGDALRGALRLTRRRQPVEAGEQSGGRAGGQRQQRQRPGPGPGGRTKCGDWSSARKWAVARRRRNRGLRPRVRLTGSDRRRAGAGPI